MKTVLIVDDDLGFQRLLGISLKKYKSEFSVTLANNGEEAISIMERIPVDLLVTDIQMPKVDGLALMAHINDAHPSLPCVIMTAHSTPAIEEQFAQGGQQLLKKPFTVGTLLKAIRTALKPPSSPEGRVSGISVANFLQMINLEQKTCLLEVTSKSGDKGFFYLEEGEVFDAVFQGFRGEEAAFALIAQDGAGISFTDTSARKVKKRVKIGMMGLIMEAMARKDEDEG